MNKFTRLTTAALSSILALSPLAELHADSKDALVYVQVRESKLRSKPEFWSTPVGDLTYGTALNALGAAPNDKAWIKAKLGEVEGFVHVSAITKKKVVFSTAAGTPNKKVDSSSVVLAGKGFNRQIENNYKASKGLDFGAVDEVEQFKIDNTTQAAFVRDGKLKL